MKLVPPYLYFFFASTCMVKFKGIKAFSLINLINEEKEKRKKNVAEILFHFFILVCIKRKKKRVVALKISNLIFHCPPDLLLTLPHVRLSVIETLAIILFSIYSCHYYINL